MSHEATTDNRSSDNFGARVKSRRESFGLSISDVSELTNVREDYIGAIERLDQSDLPAIGYSLGYVRTYAKALGMDANIAVKDFKFDIALTDIPLRDAPHVILRRQLRLPRGFVSALTVVSAAVLIGVWYGTQSEAIATPTPAETTAPEYSALQPTAPVMEEGLFTLRANSPSWVQIRDANGTVQISRIFVTGESWQGPVDGGYSVSVRDAGAVGVFNGSKSLGPLGEAGEPISGLMLLPSGPALLSAAPEQLPLAVSSTGDVSTDQTLAPETLAPHSNTGQ